MAPKSKTPAKSSAKDKGGSSKTKDSSGSGGGGDAKASASKLKPATSINVRHILCEKHARKEEALAKLREGVKFDEVAREMSEDKARQGWKTRGSLIAEFEKVAYELEVSTTGNPKYAEVKTKEGYHIVMVEGRK